MPYEVESTSVILADNGRERMRKRIWSCLTLMVVFCGIFSIQERAQAQFTTSTNGVDLMIVCAHPGDESLFLGGALPLYAGEQGRSAVVVFLSSGSNAENKAARDSLARYGDQVQAVFGTFSSVYTSNEEDALRYWDKREVTAYLVSMIRKYKPVVVISHDPLGEYGHGAHCVASDCVIAAAPFAASATDYPESKALYGIWQIQRLFLHRYGEKLVTLDRSKPLSRFNGITALELDQQGYALYPDPYPIVISDEFGYTRPQYGLAYAVPADRFDPATGDLFAGISSVYLNPTAAPLPSPTVNSAVPEPVAKKNTTAVASSVQSAEGPVVDGSSVVSEEGLFITRIAVVILGVLVIAVLFWVYIQRRKPMFRRVSLFPALIALVAFLLVCVHLALLEQQPRVEVASLPSPTPTISSVPGESVAAEVTPSPTPSVDSFDQYFSEQEVVIDDQDNEHWEYRSSTLSVIIDREHILRSDSKPISYCVAHIRMRGEDSFQAGIHTESMKAIQRLEPPWYMARRYRAVLAITGDNLTRAETELKGILIRNGKIYSANQAQDTLALYPDEFSMKVFKPKTVTPQELLDQGVVNTFSFGPTLLNNYERDLTSKRGHLGRANPRCGIGMVEPGYFIAITVDGRQSKYSVGMTMDGFAQLFYLYGCQLAYNLDGGSSTAMVFMGENLSQHSGEGSDTQRPWTDGLLWGNSELVPTIDDPVYNNGSHPWIPLPTATITPAP